jgi:anti-sigma factor RsiW
MNCGVSRRSLDAYPDGELGVSRQLDLEAHLASCPSCKSAAAKAVEFRALIRASLRSYELPSGLKPRIEKLLKKLADLE